MKVATCCQIGLVYLKRRGNRTHKGHTCHTRVPNWKWNSIGHKDRPAFRQLSFPLSIDGVESTLTLAKLVLFLDYIGHLKVSIEFDTHRRRSLSCVRRQSDDDTRDPTGLTDGQTDAGSTRTDSGGHEDGL